MQNTKSLKELVALSLLHVFNDEKHKKVNTVYACEDGNVFIDENRAKLHMKDKELQYHTITKTQAETSVGENPAVVDGLEKEQQEIENKPEISK